MWPSRSQVTTVRSPSRPTASSIPSTRSGSAPWARFRAGRRRRSCRRSDRRRRCRRRRWSRRGRRSGRLAAPLAPPAELTLPVRIGEALGVGGEQRRLARVDGRCRRRPGRGWRARRAWSTVGAEAPPRLSTIATAATASAVAPATAQPSHDLPRALARGLRGGEPRPQPRRGGDVDGGERRHRVALALEGAPQGGRARRSAARAPPRDGAADARRRARRDRGARPRSGCRWARA